jgi:hypothetical protein
MRVGTLLGIAVGLTACAESTAPVTPLRAFDQQPAMSAVVSSSKTTLNFERRVWVACANDGAGENVNLQGQIEIRTHSTENDDGGVRMWSHFRPSAVVGVGEVTGLKYRGTGMTFEGEGYTSDGDPSVYHFVNNFRIIGQGPGNNLLMHMVIHQTLNGNGELTADVDISNSDCK